jgi:hypothetical protein
MIRAIPTAMLPELSFYKAMVDEGGHGFLEPLDYDPLDSDFAPDDEDKSKTSGKARGRGRPRGRGRRGAM